VPSRSVPIPGQLSRTRWVGTVLTGTLVVLISAAMLGTWSQAALLRSTNEAAAETRLHQEASGLVTHEHLLMQAMVTNPSAAEKAELLAIQPRVISSFERLAEINTDGRSATFAELLDKERLVQAAAKQILAYLEQGNSGVAVATIESQEALMGDVRATVLAQETAHTRVSAAKVARVTQTSRLLSIGMSVLFLLGLIVLGATGRKSRTDRRMIERMAAEDALTGLPNRTAFAAHTERALRAVRDDGDRQPTVLMVDLNGFKDVNDSLGHHVGDLLLVEVAQRFRTCVRSQDVVARFGGDEFAFLVTNARPDVGEDTAVRIAKALTRPFVIEHMKLDIEASVGITTAIPKQGVTDLVRDADVAMYVAKEHHLGYSRFEPSQKDNTATRVTLVSSLRNALESGEIVLHFQPKIDVRTGRLIGAEALARWQHPTRGLLPPSEFIPTLERTSLVEPFTTYVVRQALKQARTWMDDLCPIPVAVNVSTRCLLDSAFPDTIAQCLLAAGVPGDLLCVEITESTILANPEGTIDVLRRIRALGVRTSIDDFGTGYASMAYLKILPVDEVKVDRSFVKDMAIGHKDRMLVESAIELGHNLGLTVVAEGVEDQATLSALELLGCDVAQGFYFAQALDAPTFQSWVRNFTALDAVGPLEDLEFEPRPGQPGQAQPAAASGAAQ
jgi:diguanylate cyclase (GGDEF)-like protein